MKIENNITIISCVETLFDSLFHFTSSKVRNLIASLFGTPPQILHSERAWHQNLALLREAMNKTTDPKLLNRFRFLVTNFLHKVAPHMPTVARITTWSMFESAFQVSPYSPYQYHRAFFSYDPEISSAINHQRFALARQSPLILTDTDQFAHFFPLKFIVLNRHNRNNWQELLTKALETNEDILFDFTEDFGNKILTEQDPAKEKDFKLHFKQLKNEIDGVIKSMGKEKLVQEFLKHKSAAISRIKFVHRGGQMGGMKILPLFCDLTSKNVVKVHHKLANDFVEETGIALGAIRLRRFVPEAFPLPEYPVIPEKKYSEIPFPEKTDFLNAIQQKKFAQDPERPHVALLGNAFLDMLRGLFENIDPGKWRALNQDAAKSLILQTVLQKIIDHLGNAEAFLNEDNAFLQAIELAHAELATLLELTRPFKRKDFEQIYLNQLKIIPDGLQGCVRGGLSKTAETVFSEVNVAIMAQNRDAVRTWGKGFYYEHINLIGKNQKLEIALQDSSIDEIDLYASTFNPSIDSDVNTTHYVQNNLIEDIEKILAKKPNSRRLTVAIDFTNDFFNSDKTKALLHHFENEILNGRLNFVFFGSGQKFDMLGEDQFYGSPFYLINNGEDYWETFNQRFKTEVHKTDGLSTQWFCLLYNYAAKSLDQFRDLYFKNHREALEQVSEKLSPSEDRKLVVSTADEQAEMTFVELKIKGILNPYIASLLVSYFQFHAAACNIMSSIRGSYGFLHPNITLVFGEESTSFRWHAGISKGGNKSLKSFLDGLASFSS